MSSNINIDTLVSPVHSCVNVKNITKFVCCKKMKQKYHGEKKLYTKKILKDERFLQA